MGRLGALLASLLVKVDMSEHGDVSRFSLLGIPLFVRDDKGKARVVGLHTKRLDR